jgi:hypothetical protein
VISKERLNEIALNCAEEILLQDGNFYTILKAMGPARFAYALLKAVEQESEVVAFMEHGFNGSYCVYEQSDKFKSDPLIALPLVEGD